MFKNLLCCRLIPIGTFLAGLIFLPNLEYGMKTSSQSSVRSFSTKNNIAIAQTSPSTHFTNGFVFQLAKDCWRTDLEEVTCEFLVENQRSERRYLRLMSAMFVDTQGNAVNQSNVRFTNGNESLVLPSKIPIRGWAVFKGVSEDANFNLLELRCRIGGYYNNGNDDNFAAELRAQ